MKTTILTLLATVSMALLAERSQGASFRYFGQWTTNTVAATPVKLMPNELAGSKSRVTSATILGKKDARTANTGTVYVGITSANDTQVYAIPSDGEIVIQAADGGEIPLDQWYLDVTTDNDGVIILYR